jgi:hypothetical protein
MKNAIALSVLALFAANTQAAIKITEVHPTGSSTLSYAQDFFELTNTGAAPIDITGWRFDDNSNSFTNSVALTGITSILPGKSVVFMETGLTGGLPNAATKIEAFKAAWFGTAVPADFEIGTYTGSGIGLSSSSDAVNIFDSAGARITGVAFGATTLGTTLDNAAGAGGTTLPLPIIARNSVIDVNGGFASFASDINGPEIGSPGRIAAIPEPTTLGLVALAGVALAARRRA